MIKVINRAWQGFSYAAAINLCIFFVIVCATKHLPLVPTYRAYFTNDTFAMMLQLVLVGLLSAVFAGGTVIFEQSRIGLLWQSLLYFIVTSLVWIPISGFCFGLFVYKQTMISFLLSYIGTYIVCWFVAYRTNKKEVEAINLKLSQLRNEVK